MNFSEAFESLIFRIAQPAWNPFAHVELELVVVPAVKDTEAFVISRGPFVMLRDVPSKLDGHPTGESHQFSMKLDDPDFVPWVPPPDVARARAWWPTYESTPVGWWFAMHEKNPGDPTFREEGNFTFSDAREAFLKTVGAWQLADPPRVRCEGCGYVMRHWSSPRHRCGKPACSQLGCPRYAQTSDQFSLLDTGKELFAPYPEGTLRNC